MKLGAQKDSGEGAAVKEKGRKQDWEGELCIHAVNFDKSLSAKWMHSRASTVHERCPALMGNG